MTRKLKKAPMDPFTQAVAAVLTGALKDNWKLFPKREDFCKAAGTRAGVNPETIARLLRGENSIRVDYLDHMAVLLGTRASVLVDAAERIVAPAETGGVTLGKARHPEDAEPPLSREHEAKLAELWNKAHPGSDSSRGPQ